MTLTDRDAIDAAHREQFEQEAGEAVGPMPPRDPDPQPPPEELRVDGTAQLGLFKAGGKAPGSASIRLSGGKVDLIDGKAFEKGTVITGTFTAVVREVAQRDKADSSTGIVVSCEQRHVAQITDLTVST